MGAIDNHSATFPSVRFILRPGILPQKSSATRQSAWSAPTVMPGHTAESGRTGGQRGHWGHRVNVFTAPGHLPCTEGLLPTGTENNRARPTNWCSNHSRHLQLPNRPGSLNLRPIRVQITNLVTNHSTGAPKLRGVTVTTFTRPLSADFRSAQTTKEAVNYLSSVQLGLYLSRLTGGLGSEICSGKLGEGQTRNYPRIGGKGRSR